MIAKTPGGKTISTADIGFMGLPDKNDLLEVRKHLSQDAHMDRDKRERVLKDDALRRKKKRERHPMPDYRIEVMFGSKRSAHKETVSLIRVWEHGRSLEGDRDVSMLWCAQEGCMTPWSARGMSGEIVTCPACLRTSLREECSSSLIFKQPLQIIIVTVAQLFMVLKGNADILMSWCKRDIRQVSEQYTGKSPHGDIFKEIEEYEWEKVVYPYWRIIDDTKEGQSLIVRLKDFMG